MKKGSALRAPRRGDVYLDRPRQWPRELDGTTILIVGDIHGEWRLVAAHAAAAREQYGRLDGILSVGDAEALRDETDMAAVHGPSKYRRLGQFPEVVSRRLHLGAPLWFIGGNHEPWSELDRTGPGRVDPRGHLPRSRWRR